MSKLITQINAMDKDWKERISAHWWATNYTGSISEIKDADKLLKLRDKLVELGGEECCMPFGDEDIDRILDRGELLIPEPINNQQKKYMVDYLEYIGEASQCHANSAELYWNNRNNKELTMDVRICTGYALTDDGMWRQHSWIILIDRFNNEIDTVIETTLKRVAYYGVVLTIEECEEFCSHYNWL